MARIRPQKWMVKDMMKLTKGKVEYEKENGIKVVAYANPYGDDKNKAMRGFVNIGVYIKDKYSHGWAGLRLVETAKAVFLSEPHQKAYTNKDGEVTSDPQFTVPRHIKENIVEKLKAELLK